MTPAQYGEFGREMIGTYRRILFRAHGGRIDVARIAAAVLRSLAGIVEWIGGTDDPPPGQRALLVGRNALRATLTVHDDLSTATDL